MTEFDNHKLFVPGKGFERMVKEEKPPKRQPKKGCLDFNNLPDNYLCSEHKLIFKK